jgi:hypothetical protein
VPEPRATIAAIAATPELTPPDAEHRNRRHDTTPSAGIVPVSGTIPARFAWPTLLLAAGEEVEGVGAAAVNSTVAVEVVVIR